MIGLVRPTGFEPVAYSSGGCRSIQLSYGRDLRLTTRLAPSDYRLAPCDYEVVRPAGLEPAAYWFEASRSIQLSYGRPTTRN